MRIKKVINNNILCAVDEKGNEMIVTGRGLGFKRRSGERIDGSAVEKVYRMEGKQEQQRLRELVEQIPIEDLRLTEALIEEIRGQITQPLNESLLITLADHISFAIKRKREGIEFTNPLAGAVMCYYPAEYLLGQRCLTRIHESYGIELNRDEASFIALHIVNAELNTHISELYDITRLIDGCIEVVEQYYQKQFDRDSLDFGRFVVHLRYIAQRLLQGKPLTDTGDDEDASFSELIARRWKEHYRCAGRIASYIKDSWDKELPDEELVYLTIHLRRINKKSEDSK